MTYSYTFVAGATDVPLFDVYRLPADDTTVGWSAAYRIPETPDEDPLFEKAGVITAVAVVDIDAATVAYFPAALADADTVWHVVFDVDEADTEELAGLFKFSVRLHGPDAANVPIIAPGWVRFRADSQQ